MNLDYKWTVWDTDGLIEVQKKLNNLKTYLTLKRRQSMSRYEVRLYDWILKKQYKVDSIELIEWSEEIDNTGWAHREKISQQYYLGYYNPTHNYPIYDKHAKEQQKYRAKHYGK